MMDKRYPLSRCDISPCQDPWKLFGFPSRATTGGPTILSLVSTVAPHVGAEMTIVVEPWL